MSNVIEIEPIKAGGNLFSRVERIADGLEAQSGGWDMRAGAILSLVERCKNAEQINAAQAEQIGLLQNEIEEQRAYIEANK